MTRIELNGTWECILPDFRRLNVEVPGCWDTYIDEKDIGGVVHYIRDVHIDKREGKRYIICFGAVSYYCDVYINGIMLGSHEGLWDAFHMDATDCILQGSNRIELDIVKPGYKQNDRFPLRQVLSGFIPDVLCTFGGIWDDVFIEECDGFHITSHYASGSADGSFTVNLSVDAFYECPSFMDVNADIYSPDGAVVCSLNEEHTDIIPGRHSIALKGKVENPSLWELSEPNLYTYVVTVKAGTTSQNAAKKFGFRDICAEGTSILLNGKPVYARGILHWGYYDDQIVPNPSKDMIRSEIEKVKAYGFNMIKHCLYIPREKYFELADESGVLLWIELPLWIPDVTPGLAERMKREYPAILEQIAGHPSVGFVSLGCELDDSVSSELLEEMYYLAKAKSSALVRDNSGSGECYGGLPVDYADFFDYHFYADLHFMEQLMETFTPSWRNNRPWLFGEFNDSDTMRDLNVVRKDKNTDKLTWEQKDASKNPVSYLKGDFRLHVHDERMTKYGIRQDFDLIRKLSGDHSMIHRKMTLEFTRAFREICGYNITSIRDVPIATSGMFDDLMRPKFPLEDVRQFNSDIVLVPAWDLTRIWINADRVFYKERFNFQGGEYYGLHIILSNYGSTLLRYPEFRWELTKDGKMIAEDSMTSAKSYAAGEVKELGYIGIKLPEVSKPETFVLRVDMKSGDRTVSNQWPVFVYPPVEKSDKVIGLYDPANLLAGFETLYNTKELEDDQKPDGVDLVVTTRLTPEIRDFVSNGGKVFYIQRGKGYLPYKRIAFWREGMIRCCEHDILKGIEYKTWMDSLRFFSLSTDTALDTFEFEEAEIGDVTPVIRRYDCREFTATDYMAEIRLGQGKLIATTLRFEGGMGKEPVLFKYNTFGRWLFGSILNYLTLS